MSRRLKLFTLVLGLAMVVGVPAALAAKGGNGNGGNGNGGGSSIWIEESSLRAADSVLRHQDNVSFGFTTKNWDTPNGPWLRLHCYQGGAIVFSDTRAGFEGGYKYGVPFQLGPSLAWPGGEADCIGTLGHNHKNGGRFIAEATVDFDVMP